MQPVQHLAQRRAGGSHDLGVEGVTDRDVAGFVPFGVEEVYRLVYGGAGAAKNALAVAVNVGGDDVAIHFFQGGFHHVQGGQHKSHFAVVVYADAGHLAAAGGGGFQVILERHNAGSHQRRVLP